MIYQFMIVLKCGHLKFMEISIYVSSSFDHIEYHPNFIKIRVHAQKKRPQATT